MKKIKLNRFNIIIISSVFVLLLLFVISYFRTFSDIVERDKSKIEGDTVYVNDLASDYYYWLGMNYVGDINSNSVSYTESSLKMVTINYYGYPNGNSSLTGYVSLDSDERQNKFVYYKYFPINNNQISFELIENPFSDRPKKKGFNGWRSTDGTITTDSNTKVQTITVSSSVDTINLYADWVDANVVYLRGTSGDDNLDGTRADRAVGSWSRAFELLRTRSSNTSNRDLNIIVLTGDINNSINYSNSVTQTYRSINTTYTNATDFEEDVLIAYRSGNTYYALTDNNGSIGVTTLTANLEISDNLRWNVTSSNGGYTIRNFNTNRYLSATQNGRNVSINLSNTAYVWEYNGDINGFYHEFTLIYDLYHFDPATLTSGNEYLIARGTNTLDGAGNNYALNQYNFSNTAKWRITNTSGNNYTIYNVSNNNYLTYSNANNNISLALGNSFNWTYNSTNRTFSATVTHRNVYRSWYTTDVYATQAFIGTLSGDNATLLTVTSSGNPSQTVYNVNDNISDTDKWTITLNGSYYRIATSTGRYLGRNGNNSTTLITGGYNNIDWTYDTNNKRLYQRRNNTYYYLYNNNGTWALSTSSYNAQSIYLVFLNESVNQYDETMYLAYNNGWTLENHPNNATLDFMTVTSEVVNETKPYYVRYDNGIFTIGESQTGANLSTLLFYTERTSNNATPNYTSSNGNYSSSTYVAATITSLYNHTDYRSNATWDLSSAGSGYAQVYARADLQLEYLSIDASGYNSINDGATQTDMSESYASLVGNSKNVRLGRGLTPTSWTNTSATTFAYVQGGTDGSVGSSSSYNNAFKLIIESGRYSGLMASHLRNNYYSTSNYNYYGTVNLTMGCDYDRVAEDDSLLNVFYRMGSKNFPGVNGKSNYHDLAYLMKVKSGTIGMYYFNNNTDESRAYSGIYVGGLTVSASSSSDDISSRVLIVEGGAIANINGGLRITESSGNNGVATRIYIKGGTVQNIVGGAGVSTTYGNRYISITGGNIEYSVSGGSNGVAATDESQQSGRLGGDSYVHVGGNAHIGTHGSGTLYDVHYGSVLGAGNGNQNYRTSGRVNTSHVYISGDATIEGNVYGGGNFGPVLVNSNIQIDGATIKGNVYGGANQNGVGSVSINESTIYNVTFDDDKTIANGETYVISKVNGSTRNMLTGNSSQGVTNSTLASGTVPSNSSRWLINTSGNGYTIRNANYNNYLSYTTSSTPTLELSSSTTNAIWNYDTTNKTFYRDITYTVSATVSYNFTTSISSGTEYVITNTNTNSAYSLDSNLNRTQLSTSTEPNSNVWIFTASGSGYTIRNKATGEYLSVNGGYWASLTTGTTATVWTWNSSNRRLSCSVSNGWYGSSTYYLRYYNNNWSVSTSNYSVYLATFNSQVVTNTQKFYLIYDSSWRLSTNASSVLLSTFTATSTTGYTLSNPTNGDVTITMNNGHVLGAIYGGACQEGNVAGSVTINIKGGKIDKDTNNNGSIFGGGYGQNTFIAEGVDLNISDTGNVTIGGTIYGGSALGTIIGDIDVDSIDNSGNGTITVSGDFYCGSMGDSSVSSTGAIQGNCSLTLDGGTYTGSVYGGNNANGSPTGTVIVTTGGNNNTTINNVFGGGNQADSTATSTTLNIENNSNITNAYGGGNQAAVPVTNVNLHGGSATNIYGGSNQSGDITTSNITTTGGSATNIYGGNNLGGTTTTSNVTINGGTIASVYGGGNEATTGTTNVNLVSGTVTNTYGGGNEAGVTNTTTVNLAGSTCTNVFGGSNTSGNVPISNVVATSGSAGTIYGGNNIGGRTETANVTISNITVTNVYGGGCSADTDIDNVTVNSGTITNLYAGGEAANVDTSTNVDIQGGTITNLFGGSNRSGTVLESFIDINGGTIGTVYGGNNAGGTTTTTNVNIDSGTITNVYGGGNAANSTTTNVTLNNSTNNISNIFGGCKEADATNTYVTLEGGSAYNVFGGSNTSGTITASHVTCNGGTFNNVYGGNNDGGKTITTGVNILGGTTSLVFGGGNNAETDNANVIVDNATISDTVYGGGNNADVNYDTSVIVRNNAVITNNLFGGGNNGEVIGDTSVSILSGSTISGNAYGGGNNAEVTGDTNVMLDTATVTVNIFGGGNNGEVGGSTNLRVKNGTIHGSTYAGGNGETAVVNTNTNITIEGTTHVYGHVFGGGNAAPTGTAVTDNSMGVVNITGGAINGNVYGGANTSVLYGETVVNIGYDAVANYMNNNNYTRGNISVGGTIFGGGEANASGSEVYDFDFISVTQGIIINIDGNNHTIFEIAGSIFGSGNASRTTGYSRVYINNYGAARDIKNNVSLQRADIVVLNNSHMALSGATDRTNEYSQVVFSISRVTELDLKNNSEIYLENGANLLNRFRSLNGDNTPATVQINENTHAVQKSTNNRLYMLEDKVLNIALNQNVTAYGEVDGMTFFGMFKRDRNGNIVKAMYDTNYQTGDTPPDEDMYYFSSGSYVLGLHENNHNIKTDGFYTNYDDPNNAGSILVDYIVPTPEDAEHYMWVIGVSVQSYDIELTASKYSTLGTYEFPFVNNANGNTSFYIKAFTYDDLDANVSIIDPDFIPRIAATGTAADNTMGLAIKPGIGWVTVGETYFLTDSTPRYRGKTTYKSENSNITPSLVFYLYHSKNIQTEGSIGTVVVSMQIVTPIDDLTNSVENINFNITINRALFDSNDYEGAMTPGRQYQMFTSSKMDITSKSSLSAYYSLYAESNQNIYRTGYHRVLTSNVILPVNTKITMIDFASDTRPEYYYYIVNAADNSTFGTNYQVTGEIEYPLSSFMRMGSLDTTNKYSDATSNAIYWDNTNHRAVEEFIFIVDFADTNISNDMSDCSLLLDMLDEDDNVIRSVLGIQRGNLIYNIHANHQSAITVDAEVSKNLVYVGDIEDLRVTINFNQSDENSPARIIDTTYYEQKLGIKISIINPLGNQVNGVDLMGISFTLDGETYYPRSDGTLRIKVADRVANAYSNIKINTENSSLASGVYTIKVEGFYSADGIYFGSTPNTVDTVTFRLMNELYGLKATIPETELIFDNVTGRNTSSTDELNVTLDYSGAIIEPNIKVALYRRSYEDTYDMNYNIVDLADYVSDELEEYGNNSKIYNLIDEVESTNTYTFHMNSGLVSGTYRLEFRLYDGTSYVGNIIRYIIIK